MQQFTAFRQLTDSEYHAIGQLGLKSSFGTPLYLYPRHRGLTTDDRAYTFLSMAYEDSAQAKAEHERLRAEFGVTGEYDPEPHEYFLLAGDDVIRAFVQVSRHREGEDVTVRAVTLPQALLPEAETVKKVLRAAFSRSFIGGYETRMRFDDRDAVIRTV